MGLELTEPLEIWSIPETWFTLYTGDMLYTFASPKGSSTGSTLLALSSKYPKS